MISPSPFFLQTPSQWSGDLPVTNRYTYGIALEKFFLGLKEEGRILGSHCPHCRKTYVPLTLFCQQCLAELDEIQDVGLQGEIYSYTLLYRNFDGSFRKDPQIIAFIKIADGGLIHRLEGLQIDQIRIGTLVAADIKPKEERIGSILDIHAFKPLD